MTEQGHSHGWAWEVIGPPIGECGPANQNEFFQTKGLYYRQKYPSAPVGRTAKFSKMTLEAAYGREINIKLSGNSSVGHSCRQHANCTLPQNLRHLETLCCDKTAAFYFPPAQGAPV